MNFIDLHVHSLASDGTFTPSELVDYAVKKGAVAFALTDHDTVAGVEEAINASKGKPVRVIPGVEISCEYNGKDIHILGLNIQYKDALFQERLASANASRYLRNEKMINKLAQAGFDISLQQIQEEFPDAIVTRSHISKHLMMKGYVSSITEGFHTLLDPGTPYYIPRERISPKDAIQWIHQAKGIAVLAHPLLYKLDDAELHTLLSTLHQYGLDGLEAIYSCNKGSDEENMINLANKFQLSISGGSDFHGANKPDIDLMTGKGDLYIPSQILENMFS